MIQVADHFVRIPADALQVEYVSKVSEATTFADPLEASVLANELSLPGYQVVQCPR